MLVEDSGFDFEALASEIRSDTLNAGEHAQMGTFLWGSLSMASSIGTIINVVETIQEPSRISVGFFALSSLTTVFAAIKGRICSREFYEISAIQVMM